jgi:hypothetical protein
MKKEEKKNMTLKENKDKEKEEHKTKKVCVLNNLQSNVVRKHGILPNDLDLKGILKS